MQEQANYVAGSDELEALIDEIGRLRASVSAQRARGREKQITKARAKKARRRAARNSRRRNRG